MNYLSNILDKLTASFGDNLSKVIGAILIIIIGWFIASF